MRSLNIAATGMLAQQRNIEVISNNISNSNTTGFKAQRAEFESLLYQDIRRPGAESSVNGDVVPSGIQLGAGVRTAGVSRMLEQGGLEVTNAPFDLAINGDGFFQIEMPDGETAYTRAGSFQLNQEGEIVTNDGFTVQPGIVVPQDATDVTINQDGQVFVKQDGQVAPQEVGQLELARFQNPNGLEAVGDNLFLETQASGAPNVAAPNTEGFGAIRQGALENSNVEVVNEITNMIEAQRAYEMNSRVIQTSDRMMQTLNQMR